MAGEKYRQQNNNESEGKTKIVIVQESDSKKNYKYMQKTTDDKQK